MVNKGNTGQIILLMIMLYVNSHASVANAYLGQKKTNKNVEFLPEWCNTFSCLLVSLPSPKCLLLCIYSYG